MDPIEQLISDPKEYGEKHQEHVLAQYQLYVGSAEKISARRMISNAFFTTLLTGLLGLSPFSAKAAMDASGRLPICLAGILVSAAWWLSIRSFARLNKVKFEIINEVEKRLPVRAFDTEWRIIKEREGDRHMRLNFVEKIIPCVFAAIFALLAADALAK